MGGHQHMGDDAVNRAMVLAAALFDPFRTPPSWHVTGTTSLNQVIDEAAQFTPGMRERLIRALEGRP